MKRKTTLPLAAIAAVTLAGSYAHAANSVYVGAAANPNDWYAAGNWNSTGVPGTNDYALFTQLNKGMVVSQDTGTTFITQVGRGTTNTLEITTGGIMTNRIETVVGHGGENEDDATGILKITGGTLNTLAMKVGRVESQLAPQSSVIISSGIIDVNKTSTTNGYINVGVESAASFTISGGTVTTGSDFNVIRGSLNIVGNVGSLSIDEAFNFGTSAGFDTEVNFSTNAAGAVSTIFADSFSLAGTNVLSIDGTAGIAASTLTLFSLTSDTFSSGDLTELQSALSLNNIAGTLSLANADKDLVFTVTGIPEPNSYALLGSLFALSFVVLRRR
ncbi:PEP-CTERM sorting domain-containing protein [Coraliomargarita sp. W4R53]